MTTLIPADLHFLIAPGTESLGGSYNDITPIKVQSLNSKLYFSGAETSNVKF